MKHWRILIIFGTQHQEETWRKTIVLTTSL